MRQGIKVSGSGTDIIFNNIVGSRLGFEDGEPTAILASDTSPLFGQNHGAQQSGGGRAGKDLTRSVPASRRFYVPSFPPGLRASTARLVTGGSGDGSPYPGCLIDFYRDDGDGIAEALELLAARRPGRTEPSPSCWPTTCPRAPASAP